ncbi:hypothetical protein H4R34_001434 [Dimargaris verticillata]|uniref:Uncharacterized protein n=1 Tax=Dimargaris verticillata TaxID=2761393 RepID=A0A9W8B4Q4_9FUNG|nr:hypothetical protein H4R34_001434 [Dimargaris verticillata]
MDPERVTGSPPLPPPTNGSRPLVVARPAPLPVPLSNKADCLAAPTTRPLYAEFHPPALRPYSPSLDGRLSNTSRLSLLANYDPYLSSPNDSDDELSQFLPEAGNDTTWTPSSRSWDLDDDIHVLAERYKQTHQPEPHDLSSTDTHYPTPVTLARHPPTTTKPTWTPKPKTHARVLSMLEAEHKPATKDLEYEYEMTRSMKLASVEDWINRADMVRPEEPSGPLPVRTDFTVRVPSRLRMAEEVTPRETSMAYSPAASVHSSPGIRPVSNLTMLSPAAVRCKRKATDDKFEPYPTALHKRRATSPARRRHSTASGFSPYTGGHPSLGTSLPSTTLPIGSPISKYMGRTGHRRQSSGSGWSASTSTPTEPLTLPMGTSTMPGFSGTMFSPHSPRSPGTPFTFSAARSRSGSRSNGRPMSFYNMQNTSGTFSQMSLDEAE